MRLPLWLEVGDFPRSLMRPANVLPRVLVGTPDITRRKT
jgi:hypothetical protein